MQMGCPAGSQRGPGENSAVSAVNDGVLIQPERMLGTKARWAEQGRVGTAGARVGDLQWADPSSGTLGFLGFQT